MHPIRVLTHTESQLTDKQQLFVTVAGVVVVVTLHDFVPKDQTDFELNVSPVSNSISMSNQRASECAMWAPPQLIRAQRAGSWYKSCCFKPL